MSWNEFRKTMKGKGYSMTKLSSLYKETKGQNVVVKRNKNSARSAKSPISCERKTKYIGLGIPKSEFCGPSGGACPNTYPVNTRGRVRAAKAYSRFAPNPQGIKDCADRIARRKGWI